MQLLADDTGRDEINAALKTLDDELKKHHPIVNTHAAIKTRHESMLGPQLAQALEMGLSGSDFQRLASRLSLLVDTFEIEQNGLGFNNLIFMAVVLSELAKNPEASYRGLIIEEPEAHLHPAAPSCSAQLFGDDQGRRRGKASAAFRHQPFPQLRQHRRSRQPHMLGGYRGDGRDLLSANHKV